MENVNRRGFFRLAAGAAAIAKTVGLGALIPDPQERIRKILELYRAHLRMVLKRGFMVTPNEMPGDRANGIMRFILLEKPAEFITLDFVIHQPKRRIASDCKTYGIVKPGQGYWTRERRLVK